MASFTVLQLPGFLKMPGDSRKPQYKISCASAPTELNMLICI